MRYDCSPINSTPTLPESRRMCVSLSSAQDRYCIKLIRLSINIQHVNSLQYLAIIMVYEVHASVS